jgi:hypothetical protein
LSDPTRATELGCGSAIPRWPEASTVKGTFGSWGEALIAGLPVNRPPPALALQDRIPSGAQQPGSPPLTACAHKVVLSYPDIAAELGVHPNVIGKYLHAHLCDERRRTYVVVAQRCPACANRRDPDCRLLR